MEGKYCKWYSVQFIDIGKWAYESQCGERRTVSRWDKFYRYIKREDDSNLCPKCGKPITIGALMD